MLNGVKVRLRALERADIPSFARWFNDPEVRRTLRVVYPVSLADEEKWFEALVSSHDKILGIEVRDGADWRLIGNVGLIDIDWRERCADLGIVIGERDQWGKGYGSDAIRTIARFAFDELNLHRLQLQVYELNERGRRCYERCGFTCEGTKREAVFRSGRYHDVHLMGLLARDFARSGAPPADEA
jgi:RimJ/RimL family protein N-acetyltransferase